MSPSRRHFLQLLSGLAASPLAAAEAAGLNISAASKYVASHKGNALFIKQHGKVIHESYFNGAKRGEARRIYSGTKGFWGLAAMAAVEDGLISLDEKVSATLPSWNEGGKKDIVIEQLLDFSCGLERCLRLHQDGLKDRNQMAVDRPLVGTPGRSFIYGPSPLQVFHEVLKKKLTGKWRTESPTHYLERRVLRPLGLGSQRYLADAKGNPLLAAGFLMTPAQWARMGDLLLANGRPVLKASSMDALLEGSSANAAYSFGFWNNRAAGKPGAREIDIEDLLEVDWDRQNWAQVCIAKDVPQDLIACIGSGYQRLYAIPSRGLVIVRQGVNASYSDGQLLRTLLG
ncbi:beta-lactamase [Prosthecobacter fusiformis]|uniref:Beta-lactamase n=1 Tax=Prosthecobacter fusiformis TaxID=48464 RepID=A0A4R7RY70_9BACT|nr:serine hydrolase domain-containing protein [Prosthecobacter fusiformis]TDU70802.1 beta-lactamase [Prosthecobacter fusiformis]